MSAFSYFPSDAKPWAESWYQAVLDEIEIVDPSTIKLFWNAKNHVTGAQKRVCDQIDATLGRMEAQATDCYALGPR